jgi:NitT/TauT family transport system substrate-binding protein
MLSSSDLMTCTRRAGAGLRVIVLLLIALAAVDTLAAFDARSAGQTPAAKASQAAQAVRIGVLRLPSSGPIFIAIERGYFRDEGLTPQITWFDAAAPLPVAVVSGDLDVGITGLTAAAFNLAARGGIQIIASQVREEPGFRMNAVLATRRAYDGGFTSLRQIAGRRIGITTFGSTFHYHLGLIARKYGFPLSRITFVPLQTLQNLQAALAGGQIDGALLPAPQSRQLEASGAVRILAWAGDEAPWQLGAVFTRPQTIKSQRPMIERFVRAYQKGARAYNQAFNARDAAGKVIRGRDYDELMAIISRYTKMPPAQLQDAMPFIDADARIDVGSFYAQLRFWQEVKMVDQSAKPEPLLDLTFIQGHLNVPR